MGDEPPNDLEETNYETNPNQPEPMKYSYRIECPCLGGWNAFVKDQTRSFCDGYMHAMRGQMPRLHLRLVRSDGKIMEEIQAYDDVGIGQVAGWPTAEQYERAANRALERAAKIRENQTKKRP